MNIPPLRTSHRIILENPLHGVESEVKVVTSKNDKLLPRIHYMELKVLNIDRNLRAFMRNPLHGVERLFHLL